MTPENRKPGFSGKRPIMPFRQPISGRDDQSIDPRFCGCRKPAILQDFKPKNQVFFENTPLYRTFLWAWTRFPVETGSGVWKQGIGGQIGPGLEGKRVGIFEWGITREPTPFGGRSAASSGPRWARRCTEISVLARRGGVPSGAAWGIVSCGKGNTGMSIIFSMQEILH